jgi:hypothetical protein
MIVVVAMLLLLLLPLCVLLLQWCWADDLRQLCAHLHPQHQH